MKEKKTDQFNSILLSIEYKNKLEELMKEINTSDIKKEFPDSFPNFLPLGIDNLSRKNNQIDKQLIINFNKITLIIKNFQVDQIDNAIKTIELSQQALEKVFTNSEIKFMGCVIKKEYEIYEKDIEKIITQFKTDITENKMIQFRSNFLRHNLNYNIEIIINIEQKNLLFSVDTNNIFNNEDTNFKSIFKKNIQLFAQNEIFKLLGIQNAEK